MVKIIRRTTVATRQVEGGFMKKCRDRWHGTREQQSHVEPGVHLFQPDGGFNERKVEAKHNWALANGFESELTYCRLPTAWELRVRRRGDTEPPFASEEFPRLGDMDAGWKDWEQPNVLDQLEGWMAKLRHRDPERDG
jgi:hypothetical protein